HRRHTNRSLLVKLPRLLCLLPGALTLAFATASPAEDLPEGPNQALVAAKCGACHEVSVAVRDHLSLPDWRTKVKIMIGKGAPISPQEMDQIVAYLNTYFGVTPPAKK